MRLRDWLRSWSKAERHRRKVERELWSPLPPVTPEEAADVARIDRALDAMRTGEFPIVAEVMPERPGIYRYDEPIGPQPPTVDEQYAAFELDPLSAALPGAPAKHNAFYADLLGEQPLSDPVRTDLESKTGYWTAESMRQLLERGRRS
jgi:hypothetical protein